MIGRKWWEFVHNCIAHPLLFWTANASWAVKLHDWSSHKMHAKYPKLYVRAELTKQPVERDRS